MAARVGIGDKTIQIEFRADQNKKNRSPKQIQNEKSQDLRTYLIGRHHLASE